jgi:hypothetical protein
MLSNNLRSEGWQLRRWAKESAVGLTEGGVDRIRRRQCDRRTRSRSESSITVSRVDGEQWMAWRAVNWSIMDRMRSDGTISGHSSIEGGSWGEGTKI